VCQAVGLLNIVGTFDGTNLMGLHENFARDVMPCNKFSDFPRKKSAFITFAVENNWSFASQGN